MSIFFYKKIKIYFFKKKHKVHTLKIKYYMQEIIQKYNIKAKKSLWQNFLMDEKILNEITEITSIENQNIIEVWPWFWALTTRILDYKPQSLTLVELDRDMIEILEHRIQNQDIQTQKTSFQIINQDILKYIPSQENYKVIANIPYYITSPILQHFLYQVDNWPIEMIILMQKEVWDRITSKKSSVLSLLVQKKCTVSQKIFVPSKAFSPAPKVDSAVLFFEKHNQFRDVEDKDFLAFIKAAFSNPRKKVINNLSSSWYEKITISNLLGKLWHTENTRAEDIQIEDYMFLIKSI